MQLSAPPAVRLAGAEDSTGSDRHGSAGPERGRHRPVTERIACWSARHAVLALLAWLLVVGGAVLAGHLYGTQSQPQYDPGRSGVAERMLDRLHVVTPPSESVLIQPRTPGPGRDRKSTRLNSSHSQISYAVFCLKKKKT